MKPLVKYNSLGASCFLDDKKIGELRYQLQKNSQNDIFLRSKGVIVSSKHRNMGVATLLWESVLTKEKPLLVEVFVVSDAGARLTEKIKANHPEIEWEII